MTPILEDTFEPPTMAAKGRTGLETAPSCEVRRAQLIIQLLLWRTILTALCLSSYPAAPGSSPVMTAGTSQPRSHHHAINRTQAFTRRTR